MNILKKYYVEDTTTKDGISLNGYQKIRNHLI